MSLYGNLSPHLQSSQADVAQLVEQSIRNRQVIGSSPIVGSTNFFCFQQMLSMTGGLCFHGGDFLETLAWPSGFCRHRHPESCPIRGAGLLSTTVFPLQRGSHGRGGSLQPRSNLWMGYSEGQGWWYFISIRAVSQPRRGGRDCLRYALSSLRCASACRRLRFHPQLQLFEITAKVGRNRPKQLTNRQHPI